MYPLGTHVKFLRVACTKKCSIKSSVVVVDAWRTLLPSGCQIDIKLYTLLSFRCCDAPLPEEPSYLATVSCVSVCVGVGVALAKAMFIYSWQQLLLHFAGCRLPLLQLPLRQARRLGGGSTHTSHVARLHLLCKLLIFFNNRQSNGWRGEGLGGSSSRASSS